MMTPASRYSFDQSSPFAVPDSTSELYPEHIRRDGYWHACTLEVSGWHDGLPVIDRAYDSFGVPTLLTDNERWQFAERIAQARDLEADAARLADEAAEFGDLHAMLHSRLALACD